MAKFDCGSNKVHECYSMVWLAAVRSVEKPTRFGVGKHLLGAVYTGVEVRRMDSEMSGLVERPWLQLMCCAVCLPRGRNFR